MTTLIEVSGLKKHYGRITALDGIDFSVQEGELFGLLGPNGAGKTTTVKILLGLTHATAGHATRRSTACPCEIPSLAGRSVTSPRDTRSRTT
jgi:ABC-type multidrug transport system ATPase subunit